jgi:DNA repair photolyase
MAESGSQALRDRKTKFIDIFRTTPPRTVCPNFYVLSHANGCAFSPQCSYCYLKSTFWFLKDQQAFTNSEDMIDEIRQWIARDDLETYVLNTGNLSDSLAFEQRRPLMAGLVEVFRAHARGRPHTLLLVTKGGVSECAALLEIPACPNVVVSFSVNHPDAARQHERGAATPRDRMEAASRLKAAGWRVRIRIDPMILGFDYAGLVDEIARFGPERVTLGSLRAERSLMRFVGNGIFRDLQPPADEHSIARYSVEQRLALYRPAVAGLRSVCPVALCEEEEAVWDALGLDKAAKPCNCCQ